MKRNLYLLSLGLVLCSCSEQYDVVTGHARVITKSTPVIEATPAPEPVISAPVIETVAEVTPAPAPEIVAAEPVAAPAIEEKPSSVISQNQPALTEPTPAPEVVAATPLFAQSQPETTEPAQPVIIAAEPAATQAATEEVAKPAPKEEEKPAPVISQNQPMTSEPAPAPEVKQEPAPVIAQQQPVTTSPAPAPQEEVKKPTQVVAQPQPSTVTPAPAPAQPQVYVQAAQDKPIIITKTQPAPTVTAQPLMVKPSVVKPNPVAQQQPRYSTPQAQPKKRSYPVMPGQNRGLRRRDNSSYQY